MTEVEVEVFRLIKFDTSKCYEFALKTKTVGRYPNEKYYTTNPLKYLGTYTHSEDWGCGDGHGGAENFNDNGVKHRIVYDYEGKTCFREVPAPAPTHTSTDQTPAQTHAQTPAQPHTSPAQPHTSPDPIQYSSIIRPPSPSDP